METAWIYRLKFALLPTEKHLNVYLRNTIRRSLSMRQLINMFRLMEHNCVEAIYNNVFGTQNLVELCEEYGAERFMMVSTDKAVNPTNVMGATKRMCEMIVQSASTHGKVKYSATRFGNVLGSAGSVIPLFKRQIANGGPVTVTDKRIIRYFHDNSGGFTACSSEWSDCK